MFAVPDSAIRLLLDGPPPRRSWETILAEVGPSNPLSIDDAASIIRMSRMGCDVLPAVVARAAEVKAEVLGDSVKLFVPVYLSNICENDCVYCAYRSGHDAMPRRTLSEEDFRREIAQVLGMGYRVIELVTSESPELKGAGRLARYVSIAREMADSAPHAGEDAEVILMSWALSEDEFAEVRAAGCDAFYLWQETYDRDSYAALHPAGTPKADFDWRVQVFDRALRAGIRRVGLGVLFGLASWDFDVLALIAHGKYLEETYGVPVDVIGIPRFKPASGTPLAEPPNPVSDDELRLAVALYRLAFPHSQVFLNTREKLSLMLDLLAGGGSEMNVACAIFPGGYTEQTHDRQFEHYSYPTDKTLRLLREKGYRPSHFVTGQTASK